MIGLPVGARLRATIITKNRPQAGSYNHPGEHPCGSAPARDNHNQESPAGGLLVRS